MQCNMKKIMHIDINLWQIFWAFSIYLEAVAILPQLVLLQRSGNVDNLAGQYVFFLGYVHFCWYYLLLRSVLVPWLIRSEHHMVCAYKEIVTKMKTYPIRWVCHMNCSLLHSLTELVFEAVWIYEWVVGSRVIFATLDELWKGQYFRVMFSTSYFYFL